MNKKITVAQVPEHGRCTCNNRSFVVFDDDMVPAVSCVQQFISFNKVHKNCIALGQIIEPASKDDTEIKKYKDYLNTTWNNNLNAYKNKIIPNTIVVLSAANFSILHFCSTNFMVLMKH